MSDGKRAIKIARSIPEQAIVNFLRDFIYNEQNKLPKEIENDRNMIIMIAVVILKRCAILNSEMILPELS
jgi:hypothetical protein